MICNIKKVEGAISSSINAVVAHYVAAHNCDKHGISDACKFIEQSLKEIEKTRKELKKVLGECYR